jgi:hypothetical protein
VAQEALGACPICGGALAVAQYDCTGCGVSIRGGFRRCDLCSLPTDLLHFVRVFLRCEGNFKQVERELGISYPTVKARLQKIKQSLELEGFSDFVESQKRLRLLEDFRDGRVTKDELLRDL